ncbi:hypothetical protein ACWC0A_18325 [Streptomyces scopuliridis]
MVGTGHHRAGSRLTDLPSATRSAAGPAAALHAVCGMPEEQVQLITDPAGLTDVLAAVAAAVDRAEGGVVVFCFVGHGLLGPGDQLYLATGTTSAHNTVHAVPCAEIRNLLSAAPVRPVVILDRCFSGRSEAWQGHPLHGRGRGHRRESGRTAAGDRGGERPSYRAVGCVGRTRSGTACRHRRAGGLQLRRSLVHGF